MALALGLAVALTYGTADFLGGLATKRNRAFAVVALSQAWGLLVLVVAWSFGSITPPAGTDLVLGSAIGALGLVGVSLLYQALASGAMGVIAPITAVGAAVLPLAWGLANGERPSPVALLGVVVALVAVALIAGGPTTAPAAIEGTPVAPAPTEGTPIPPAPTEGTPTAAGAYPTTAPAAPGTPPSTSRRPLLLAVGAGAAFGLLFILLAGTSDDSGLSPLIAARVVSVTLLGTAAAVTRQPLRLAPGSAGVVAGAGLLDMAANVLFVLAARRGLLSLVAVLASLYPAATTLLARFVLGERLARTQVAGFALALVGLILIAAG